LNEKLGILVTDAFASLAFFLRTWQVLYMPKGENWENIRLKNKPKLDLLVRELKRAFSLGFNLV